MGFDGDDVILRFRTAAAAARLDQPELRLRGALTGLPRSSAGAIGATGAIRATGATGAAGAAGATGATPAGPAPVAGVPAAAAGAVGVPVARIRAWKAGRSYCLAVNGRERCGLGWGLARSWAVLLYPPGLPSWLKMLADLLWLGALFLPSGLLLRRRSAPVVVAVVVAGLALIPPATGLLPTPLVGYVAALCGLALGAALAALSRRAAPVRPPALAGAPTNAAASAATQRSMRA